MLAKPVLSMTSWILAFIVGVIGLTIGYASSKKETTVLLKSVFGSLSAFADEYNKSYIGEDQASYPAYWTDI